MDEFWLDIQVACDDGDLTEAEFLAYLERQSYLRSIELLGGDDSEWL